MIIFTQPLAPERLRMAFNNDVIRFRDDTVTMPEYCDISIENGPAIRLYPAPDGSFYFNFKPYIAALINTNNFEDTVQTDLLTTNPSSFVYPGTAVTDRNVHFTIYNDAAAEAAYRLYWLAGMQQPGENKYPSIEDLQVLAPALPDAANTWYLKYWQGYPFDISVCGNFSSVSITNLNNLISENFDMGGSLSNRLFFSDGRTDETLEDLLPLSEGHNNLKLVPADSQAGGIKFIHVEKASACKGVYLKWFNGQGGYSYWLFENTYSIDRSARSLGELDRDFENIENSFGRTTQLGREVQDTIKIIAELLTEPQRNIVQNLLESPKVYLFTGAPYSRSDYRSWIEVSVKTTGVRIKNPREELTNFTFDIELPTRYTQTL